MMKGKTGSRKGRRGTGPKPENDIHLKTLWEGQGEAFRKNRPVA